MFLTDSQLEDLTGYVSRRAQARWLAANGYRFDVRSDGRPNVLLRQLEERQVGKSERARPGPDFSWMTEAG